MKNLSTLKGADPLENPLHAFDYFRSDLPGLVLSIMPSLVRQASAFTHGFYREYLLRRRFYMRCGAIAGERDVFVTTFLGR